MNEAWMDECAARLQPLVDQYKPIQHQTFAIGKFQDLIATIRSCPEDKKISFKNKILVHDTLFFSLFRYPYIVFSNESAGL